jgi:hypothetical protein
VLTRKNLKLKKMKNILKLLSLSIFVGIAFSCGSDSSDDLKFTAETESGWIQFMNYSPEVINAFPEEGGEISMNVNIVVPNTSSDLTINYDLVSVIGDDPNSVFSDPGNIIVPAGQTSYMGPNFVEEDADENPIDESGNNTGIQFAYLAEIVLNIDDIAGATLSGPMIFDVVLTGTSSSEITAGLAGETFKVSQRIAIVPAASLAGTYSVSEPGVSLGAEYSESYQVELAYNAANPLVFSATNSALFDTYFFGGTTMTLGNGGITASDNVGDPRGIIVALADYYLWDVDDVIFGEDGSGNATITFGTNTGLLFFRDSAYTLVLTKM